MEGNPKSRSQNPAAARPEPGLIQPLRDDLAPVVGAAVSTALFALAAFKPSLWPVAILAPLPILAVAPELPDRHAGAFAFSAYLFGNLWLWPSEVVAAPLWLVAGAHCAGAALFASFIVLAAEATRRWTGWFAALAYPTVSTAIWFAVGERSPHGTWSSPAYSVATLTPLMQLTSFTGLAGVVFMMGWVPAGLAVAFYRRRWSMGFDWVATVPLASFALVLAAGMLRMATGDSAPQVKVGVGATDRGIELFDTNQPPEAAQAIQLFAPIVHQLAVRGAKVVVLPEKIVGATPRDEDEIAAGFAQMARMDRVWLVVGINQINRAPRMNEALVFSADGSIVARYHKRYPVPGLEDGYRPGSDLAVFDAPWGRTGVAICKDLDFPKLGRDLAMHGARMVLVPGWDWPGTEAIHARMAAARGVESGFSVARAARQGVVSLTDSRGRTIAESSTIATDPALAVAGLSPGAGATFYARHGEWFGWLSIFAALMILARFTVGALFDRWRRRREVDWKYVETRLKRPADAASASGRPPAGDEEENQVLDYPR